jgi:inner membrane transporter RhtA
MRRYDKPVFSSVLSNGEGQTAEEETMGKDLKPHSTLEHARQEGTNIYTRDVLRAKRRSGIADFIPPHVLVFLSIISVQLGASLAKKLFPVIGSGGTVFLRLAFGAIILLLFWRPRLRSYTRSEAMLVGLFGLTIAVMNASFYAAIARIPLGIAVTLEFIGPLGVAVAASRRVRDLLWVVLAAAGIFLLAPIDNAAIDPVGVGFALLAAGGWAAYILLTVRVGRALPGGGGLAVSMSIAALVIAPFGIASGGSTLLHPDILLMGLGIAVLSSVIPFSLELEILRHLSARVFGVLMSLEPAIATLIGFIVLGETVGLRAIIAITLIVMASGGVSLFHQRDTGIMKQEV